MQNLFLVSYCIIDGACLNVSLACTCTSYRVSGIHAKILKWWWCLVRVGHCNKLLLMTWLMIGIVLLDKNAELYDWEQSTMALLKNPANSQKGWKNKK